MERIGITEVLVLVAFFVLIAFLIIKFTYQYGKKSGKNEILEKKQQNEM